VDKFLFISGVIGIDPVTNILGKSFEDETKLAMQNIEAILKTNNTSFDNVFKATVFLKEFSKF